MKGESIENSTRKREPLHAHKNTSTNDDASRINVKVDKCQPLKKIESFANEFELKKRLYETGKCLVIEGEKNISLALDLEKIKDSLRKSRSDNEQIRLELLSGINGGIYDTQKHSNIPLTELLRIRLQEYEDGIDSSISFNYSSLSSKKITKINNEDTNGGKVLNRSLHKFKERESTNSAEDENGSERVVDRLRMTMHKMNDRSRRDRELKQKLQRQTLEANRKVDALSDHIEKLMVHLKHEALTKTKVLNERSKHLKEIDTLKRRNQIMENRNIRKDHAMSDLKEGGKLLEDQLSLMDEKYMELRMKLDWTRSQTEKILRNKDEEVKDFLQKSNILQQRTRKA